MDITFLHSIYFKIMIQDDDQKKHNEASLSHSSTVTGIAGMPLHLSLLACSDNLSTIAAKFPVTTLVFHNLSPIALALGHNFC